MRWEVLYLCSTVLSFSNGPLAMSCLQNKMKYKSKGYKLKALSDVMFIKATHNNANSRTHNMHVPRREDALPGVARIALKVRAQQPLELTATPALLEAAATLKEVLADASLAAREPSLVQLGMRGAAGSAGSGAAGRADAPAHWVANETGAALQCWLGPRSPAGAPPEPGADGTRLPSSRLVLLHVIARGRAHARVPKTRSAFVFCLASGPCQCTGVASPLLCSAAATGLCLGLLQCLAAIHSVLARAA